MEDGDTAAGSLGHLLGLQFLHLTDYCAMTSRVQWSGDSTHGPNNRFISAVGEELYVPSLYVCVVDELVQDHS